MSIESAVAISTHEDLVVAAGEAAAQIHQDVAEPAVLMLFITHAHGHEAISQAVAEVRKVFTNGAPVMGGTVNGVTYADVRYDALFNNRKAVALVALGGKELRVGAAIVGDPIADPVEAGRQVANEARNRLGGNGQGGIILTPGMSGHVVLDQPILDGIRSVNPRLRLTGTGLTAGLLPDGMILPGYAFLNDRIEHRGVVLCTFSGAAALGFASANGMEAVGGGGFVTDAEGPVIKTIDKRPAKEAILDLLCGQDQTAREQFQRSAFIAAVERGITLGAADPEGTHFWCHMPVAFTPDGGAIDPFVARKGTPLSVVRIDPSTCLSAVKEAGDMLTEDAGTNEFAFTLAFSCALRGYTLGADVAHEDMGLHKQIKTKKHLGIVASGEVGCYRHGRPFATGWVYALFGLAEQRR